MNSNKGEASKCVNTIEASSVRNLKRVTDMKSIANNQLTFHNTKFNAVQDNGQVWLTSTELGAALQYSDDKAVQRIYSRRCDEFTEQMTRVVKVTTPRGQQETRIFSLRGAHLIAMFSRTTIAKEFRKWVLDILDREVAQGNSHSAFDFDIALHNARGVNIHLRAIKEMWRDGLEEALRLMEYKNRGNISERLRDMTFFSSPLEISLNQHGKKKKIH